MARQTSLEAYKEIKAEGKDKVHRSIILDELDKAEDGLTRNEISRNTGLGINVVCGRIRELLNDGKVFEDGTRVDSESGKKNYVIYGGKDGHSN